MPRLSDALDRAGMARREQTPPADAAAKSSDEVLRTWHFDTGDPATPPSAAAAAPAAQPAAPEPAVVPAAVSSPAPARAVADAGSPSVRPAAPAAPRAAAVEQPGFRISADAAGKIVAGEGADPVVVEQYRRLAAVLHNAQVQRRVRSVMIASGAAAEGKTLAATNLALTLAESFDRRVLLIDADLRQPSLHELFCLPNERGLLETLRRPDGGRLPVHSVTPRLWVLTAGRPTSDPMSGLVSDAMKQLVADAVDQFDWVIVDTPPVAVMPDAKLLANLVDGALLVIRANATPYPIVQRAVTALGADRIFGVLLNRADRPHHREYGYYGYGYTYDRGRGAARARAEHAGASAARG